ncbi:XdhC family protein [Lentibacter algarum]|uniref:XdhC family protein n=1 Tax=Lentibacter algarum TaxID=576131 RepID=UPI003AF9730B
MSVPALDASTVIEPIRQLSDAGGAGVLCVITHVDGPSYRPLGAMMAVLEDGRRIGTLSSGCVEADIALHAAKALDMSTRPIRCATGRARLLQTSYCPAVAALRLCFCHALMSPC